MPEKQQRWQQALTRSQHSIFKLVINVFFKVICAESQKLSGLLHGILWNHSQEQQNLMKFQLISYAILGDNPCHFKVEIIKRS